MENQNEITVNGKEHEFSPVEKLTFKHCVNNCGLFKECRGDETIYPCTKELRKDGREGFFIEKLRPISYF